MKKVRSLILADATSYEEFYQGLKQLEFPFQAIIKDLRSQVVREGCITVAYLSTILGSKLDRMAEILMIPLLNLIQNSAKVKINIWWAKWSLVRIFSNTFFFIALIFSGRKHFVFLTHLIFLLI